MLHQAHLKQMLTCYRRMRNKLEDQIEKIQCFLDSEECHNVGINSPILPDFGFSNEQMGVIMQCRVFVLRKQSFVKELHMTIRSYTDKLARQSTDGPDDSEDDECNSSEVEKSCPTEKDIDSESKLKSSLANFFSILMQLHGDTEQFNRGQSLQSLMDKVKRFLSRMDENDLIVAARRAVLRLMRNYNNKLYTAGEFVDRLDFLATKISENLNSPQKLENVKILPFSMPKSIEKILDSCTNCCIIKGIYDSDVKFDLKGQIRKDFKLYRCCCHCQCNKPREIVRYENTEWFVRHPDNLHSNDDDDDDDLNDDGVSSSGQNASNIQDKPKSLKPFAIADYVEPESIGSIIGLKPFDKFIEFGSLTKSTFKRITDMNKEIQKFIGKDFSLAIIRNGIELDIFLPRRLWKFSEKVGVGLSIYQRS